jgi:putative heme-binding domain-containing protein
MRKAPLLVTALLAAVLAYPPASRAQHETGADLFSGEQVFQSLCANCHGRDGALVPNVDLGHGVFRQPYSDAQLVTVILKGIPNTPMPANPTMSEAQAQLVVDYLRSRAVDNSSALAGDATKGRSLFEDRGNCQSCHMVAGTGSPLGGELTRIGDSRTVAELTQSLRTPNAVVQPNLRWYAVTTKAGATVSGRLMNRDAFSVQLLDGSSGKLRSFNMADLSAHSFAASPMPALGSDWSDQDVADLVAYLASLRAPAKQGATP